MDIGSKLTTRKLLQQNKLAELIRANPDTFNSTVNPAIFSLQKGSPPEEHSISYVDATNTVTEKYRHFVESLGAQSEEGKTTGIQKKHGIKEITLPDSASGYSVKLDIYRNTLQNAFFDPTGKNMELYETVMSDARGLYDRWSNEVRDSATVRDNLEKITSEHVGRLDPGDTSVLGLLTLGGVGLHTGSNEEYISYLDGTEAAEKLKSRNNDFAYREKNENKYSWISRVIESKDIAEVSELTEKEKKTGISGTDRVWVPITKGKGKSFYSMSTEYINWSEDSVERIGQTGLHRNREFYFSEGIFAVGQGTGDPSFRYTNNCVIEHSGNILVPHTDKVSTLYLLGILNSGFSHYLIDQFINHTVNTQLTDFRTLPVIIPTNEQMSQMESLVEEAISIRVGEGEIAEPMIDIAPQNRRGIDEVISDIDELVTNIYGISEI